MDRWNIVATLNYLPHRSRKSSIVMAKVAQLRKCTSGRKTVACDGAHWPISPAPGFINRRYLDRDVAAHRYHLGGECSRSFSDDVALGFPLYRSSINATRSSAQQWRNIISAASGTELRETGVRRPELIAADRKRHE